MNKSSVFFPVTLLLCTFIIAGFMAAPNALAQVTFTSDEEQFFADNPGLVIQRFNSAITSACDVPFDSTNSAGCFPPGAIYPGVVYDVAPSHEFVDIFGFNFNGSSGNTSKAIGPDNRTDTLDIIFDKGGVTAAGVRPGCFVLLPEICRRTITISVFGAGDALLGSTEVDASSLFDDFLGIESDIPVVKISVRGPDLGPASGFHAISELVFPQVRLTDIPALSEWGMIAAAGGLGLVGVFFAVRRRRAINS